ncbi:MAG TPA: hypothetical protein VGD98_05990 [Ktedonobacteraceae bacterium]
MKNRGYRGRFLQVGLLASLILLAACGQAQSQTPLTKTTSFTPLSSATPTIAQRPFALAGASVWILSCLDGWAKQQIYQDNPFYTNQQGAQEAKDIYVFGNFWLQPDTGTLWPYSNQPQVLNCLSDLLTTAHTRYHARVCAVVSVDETGVETGRKWPGSAVPVYTRRAAADPGLLTPIVEQARKYPYDCLINDLEDGDRSHPETFARYDGLLRGRLPLPLGQTLLWKTPQVSAYWQVWEDWRRLASQADFFIVMALDHDSLNDPPVPASIVNADWVKQVYTYMRSIPHLFGNHPVAWEFPTYYRLFTGQKAGKWTISAGTDVEAHIAAALKSQTILQNYLQDPNDPYLEYMNPQGQDTYLFFETARSSDVLAQLLTESNQSTCLLASFWDNDSGTANSLGWSLIAQDQKVHLC